MKKFTTTAEIIAEYKRLKAHDAEIIKKQIKEYDPALSGAADKSKDDILAFENEHHGVIFGGSASPFTYDQLITVSQMTAEMGREGITNTTAIKVEEVESYPPNCNPFNQDLFHMGSQITGNWMAMYKEHIARKPEDDEAQYMYLINTKTGRRFRLDLSEANKPK